MTRFLLNPLKCFFPQTIAFSVALPASQRLRAGGSEAAQEEVPGASAPALPLQRPHAQ